MKKALSLALVVVMALMMVAGCGCNNNASSYTAENTEYFIGATGPLSGEYASYGTSVKNGAELAIKEINANGGLDGVNFKFDIKDDQGAADKAKQGYLDLYEAGMQIGLGSVTSGACKAFAEQAAKDELFFITPSASEEKCIEAKNAFRVCFGDPDQGILAAEEITKNYKNIGAIYEAGNTYSEGIYAAFEAKMKELKVDYKVEKFDATTNKDFSTQVGNLKDCDVIFLPIYYEAAGLIANEVAKQGSSAVIFGCDGLDGVASQIDETVKNKIKYITPFDVKSTDEKVVNFVKAYKDAYKVEPDQFAADGYDAVYVIYNAMKKAGVKDVTIAPEELCDVVVKIITAKDFSFSGLTGDMTWDASGAATKKPIIVELN